MFLYGNIYIPLYVLITIMDNKKETISLKINPELWTEAKHKCLDKKVKYSEYVEGLIKKDLGKK